MIYVKKNILAMFVSVVVVIVTMTGYSHTVAGDDDVLISDEITVEGFQMKTDVTEAQGISFRTLCQAPDVGSTITVDEQNYTVTGLGVVYVKDPNTSGNTADRILDKTYTVLDSQVNRQSDRDDSTGFKYVGSKDYQGVYLSFGYVATDAGIVSQSDGYSVYTRTLTAMDDFVCNTIFARAFVEATDESGEDVIIYGTYASVTSVASVAYRIYINGLASNKEGHEYLYDSILSQLPEDSPFYLDETVEYGWSGVVTP